MSMCRVPCTRSRASPLVNLDESYGAYLDCQEEPARHSLLAVSTSFQPPQGCVQAFVFQRQMKCSVNASARRPRTHHQKCGCRQYIAVRPMMTVAFSRLNQ